jgi:autotransporter-associated beta strand protein
MMDRADLRTVARGRKLLITPAADASSLWVSLGRRFELIGPSMKRIVIGVLLAMGLAPTCRGALTFTVEANGWPDAARRNAAVNALQAAVNRYNAFGDFGNYNVYAYYNAGIPTAQASYLGSIGYGGTYPNERVTLHEMSHYLGTGTYGDPWDGFRGELLIDQFDGNEAVLNGGGSHYWPYGLNYDNEMSEINAQRHVALLYAMRRDMGIGSTAIPGATVVNLTASDPVNESGFNYASRWSDAHFAHAGAAYTTGNFALRTPQGYNSWTFAGESLTVNNTTAAGGFRYNSWGTTGVITIKNLIVSGGSVRHDQYPQDMFQLAGRVTLGGNATFDAAQGPIRVLADVRGTGSLTKIGNNVMTLTGGATYAGNTTINAGTLRVEAVSPVASYTFDSVSGSTVNNTGSGGAAMNGVLTGGASIVGGGRFGNALSVSGGSSVNINNGILDLRHDGNWTVSAWVKTSTPGGSIINKGDGTGWSNGNTSFYLGDGTAAGTGSIPGAVRWAGGFYQGSTAATPVTNNTWRQVTYVNSGGNYAIYVDGALQPLSAGNSSFANFDYSSVVRLGAATNPGDGAVNFNGLLDSVQFFNQALSGPQISALYQGAGVVGSLPSTTHVTIASGATLDVNGTTQTIASLSGGGMVLLEGGRLNVNSTTDTLYAGGISGGDGGTLVKAGPGTLTLAADTFFTGSTAVRTEINGGTLRANGTISGSAKVNAGGVLQGGGSIGHVTVASGGVFAPGDGVGFLDVGSLTLESGSHMQIELGGTTPSDDHDVLVVNHHTVLGGTLAVSLVDGFSPSLGDSFEFLFSYTTSGMFDSVTLPELSAGLAWDMSEVLYGGVLSVIGVYTPGDFDRDYDVDGDDLDAWRPAVGPFTPGDADGDGDSDGSDFLIWQRNLGASGPPATTAAVPEPSSLWALSIALLATWRRRAG